MNIAEERERKTRIKSAYFAEFWGCFFINFCMHSHNRSDGTTYTPFVIGSAFFLAVFLSHRISGAHLNAAVTFSIWLKDRNVSKHENGAKYAGYVIAQVLGGLAAGFLISFMGFEVILHDDTDTSSIAEAITVLAFFTFFLCIAYYHINDPSKPEVDPVIAAITIGAVMFLTSMTMGPATGGVINPSTGVAIGICRAIFTNANELGALWIWVLSPFIGAFGGHWFYVRYLKNEPTNEK